MSAILKGFTVALSKKQTAEINGHLNELKKTTTGEQYFVLSQTATKFGSFDVINGQLQFAVIKAEAGKEIAKILEAGYGKEWSDPNKCQKQS